MAVIEVKKDFKFAEKGVTILEYTKGQVVDVSDECAAIAIEEKWAVASSKEPEQNQSQGQEGE